MPLTLYLLPLIFYFLPNRQSSILSPTFSLRALLLAAALTLASAPALRAQQNSGTCGDGLNWNFNPATATLAITGGGTTMYDYEYGVFSSNPSPWSDHHADITTVTFATPALTNIGACAFYDCSALTAIDLPAGLTSIGEQAFSFCTALPAIDLPAGLTSIGEQAFTFCTALPAIDLPAGLTSIGTWTFAYCDALTAIDLPPGITTIDDYTFYQCAALTAIDLAGITNIGYGAFYQCTALTVLTLHGGLAIGDAAFYFSGLAEVILPENFSGTVTADSFTFHNCARLRTLNYSVNDPAFTVTNALPAALASLPRLVIGECVTSIPAFAFAGRTQLREIAFNATNFPAFKADTLFPDSHRAWTSVTIGAGVRRFTAPDAFYFCASLTEITFPPSIEELPAYVFNNCTLLTRVTYQGAAPAAPSALYTAAPNTLTSYVYASNAHTYSLENGTSFAQGNARWRDRPIAILPDPWLEIADGGTTAGCPGVPLILLPGGGRYDPTTSNVTDRAGGSVYYPGQRGVSITAIDVTPGAVTLTLAQPGAVIFGKPALDAPAWTYLAAPSHAPTATATLPAAAGTRFFTAREE